MSSPRPNDWNQQVIEEFHAHGGKVGGPFENTTVLLLHTRGAKSNQPRINPLVYVTDDGNFVIAASKAGAPTNPDWYYNILAHPDVTIEVGTEQFPAHAVVFTEGEERDRLYNKIVSKNPGFAEYQQKTSRRIPVIVLKRS